MFKEKPKTASSARPTTLQQLMVIEAKLLEFIEIRDYLTCHLRYNEFQRNNFGLVNLPPQKYQRALQVFEMEKQMEAHLKNKRHEEQKEEEKNMLLQKKLKQEEKIKRLGGSTQEELYMNQFNVKPRRMQPRMPKPDRKEVHIQDLNAYTEAELDYLYYVDNIHPDQLRYMGIVEEGKKIKTPSSNRRY